MWLAVLAVLAAAPTCRAQSAPAGTSIVNTATGAYTRATALELAASNPVTTQVLTVYGLRIGPPGSVAAPAFALSGPPGDTLYCRLTLDNLGNAPDSAVVSATIVPPSTLTPAAVLFFRDADGDRRFDAGEDAPSFLALAAGTSTPVDVAIVLPPIAGGSANVEVRVTSAFDPNPAAARPALPTRASDATVVRVTSVAGAAVLYLGPAGNPRALPGGEGSSDDATRANIGLYDEFAAFEADVENAGDPDSVAVSLARAGGLPPGVSLRCADANGTPYPAAPRPGWFTLGGFATGQVRVVRFTLSSPGTPLRVALGTLASLAFTAASVRDTLVTNGTRWDLSVAQAPDALAMLGLEQTFRQPTAALGDIVTMIVTATNRTDSVRVDQVVVTEGAPPALDFAGGDGVTYADGRIDWAVGTLLPGESRSTAVKFAVNSRESKGWARVAGVATGLAQTGGAARTGQVVAAIRIDNEEVGIEGFLWGDVWIDGDGDGRRDGGERGAANVSVYLESGEYAVTDSSGMFTIPHVFEGRRIVRLDESTLPPGTELVGPPATASHQLPPHERLVHLIAPAHARVAFPLRVPVVPPVARTASLVAEERVAVAPRPSAGATVTLPSWRFPVGKATPPLGSRQELVPVARFLAEHPQFTALVEGHTDGVRVRGGRFRSNQELSVARAEAVRDALIWMGVAADQFVVRGYGERRPIASNATPEGRAANRRVDVSILPPAAGSDDPEVRIAKAIRVLPGLPDSVEAAVHWFFNVTAERPQRATIRAELPAQLAHPWVQVRLDHVPIAESGGQFVIEQVARGARIECSIGSTLAVTDTQAIREVRATVRLDDSVVPADSTARTAVLRPHRTQSGSVVSEVLTWTELVPAPAAPPPSPAAALPGADPGPPPHAGSVAILEPADGFVASGRDQVTVRVRHPLGSRLSLAVAGDDLGEDRVGQRTVDVTRQEETTTWYGVRLRGGWNEVVARAATLGGGEAADTVRVALATRPAEIVPLDGRLLLPADGRSTATLRFGVRDGFGLPVMDGFVVTVTEGEALSAADDARPSDRGLQLHTRGGIVAVPLGARHETGAGTVAVEAAGMRAETEVVFVDPARPLLASGVVDAAVGSYHTHGEGSGHGVTNFRDGLDAEAQARAFVQGTVPGGFRLTARLDTRKHYDDPLLKQPDPEQQYPIFGDASAVHYAAPARGGNYVSLDRGRSYLRYSDFQTPIDRGEFLTYHQVATGLSGALGDEGKALRAFVSQTDLVTRTDNLPADGTSGFYYLTQAPVVENSERVLVETRDRFQSEKVLEARVMMRRRDYVINPYDASILFLEPVPVTDRDLNPNFVVVTYETETGASDAYLFGMRGDVVRGNQQRAGITAVANSGDGPNYALFGADGELRLPAIRLAGEFARSDDDLVGTGSAYKVSAAGQRGLSKLDLYVRRVDGDFSNPSFRGADSELASLKAGFAGRLASTGPFALDADGYTHELSRTGEHRTTLRTTASYRRRLLEISAGARAARHAQPDSEQQGVLTLLGVTLGSRGGTGLATIWEQNVGREIVDDYPNRVRTTLGVPVARRFRAVATHEYLTARGRPSTHQVTAGVEGTTDRGTQAYMRYALDRAANDARMGAVSGIRQRLALGPASGASVGIEAFHSLAGRRAEEYVSFTTGLSARRPGAHFVDAGYEYRWERAGNKHLLRVSVARQLGGGVALLGKQVLGLNAKHGPGDGTQSYTTLAGAYRSPQAPLQSLVMLKSRYDRHAPMEPDATSWRLVASADVNLMASASHEVRLKYAYKHAEDRSYGLARSADVDLALAQYVVRLGRGWDLDAWGRTAALRHGRSSQLGAGLEIGRLVYDSVRVGAGYSINGFDDPDISGTDAWSEGFGIRVQMVLSDWMLPEFAGLK